MSHSSPELNETQNHCEANDSNQSTSYQMSRIVVPNIVCHNDSYIFDDISYNSENKMLNE